MGTPRSSRAVLKATFIARPTVELHRRARQMANALAGLGIARGERVATLGWNGYRHMELYFAVSGAGSVLHTINPRLHPEQIAWIVNHAEDQALFFDLTFLPLVENDCSALQDRKAMGADDRPGAYAGREIGQSRQRDLL